MSVFGKAADWLEHGRPEERSTAGLGALLWNVGGRRAFERQDPDAYRLSMVGPDSVLAYEIVGVQGEWLR
jgi:hypothetical protein